MMRALGALLLTAIACTGIALAVGSARAQTPKQRVHRWVGIGKCGTCHGKELYGDQVSAWRRDPHARAFDSLLTPQSAEVAARWGLSQPADKAPECLECHVSAHGVPATSIKYEVHQKDGVQCESCHGPGADYRKKSVMADEKKSIARGLFVQSAQVCQPCHNERSPFWDPKRYALPDGTHAGFDYEQAAKKYTHPIPEDRRGKIIELEKQLGETDEEEDE